jgi:gamma-glutamyltranspeptidase/glutathione hydrolase
MIDPSRALDPLPPSPLPGQKSTVYITVVDRDRNACSFINTVYYGFGSGIMAPKSGVLLQNRGMGFVVDMAHPNRVEPGKRPLHTIIPAMATRDGRVAMSFGVMGGEYQAFGHMQLLTRMLDYGMDIQMAQDLPRFFPDPFTNQVEVETPVPSAIIDTLVARGHDIAPAARPIGGSQAIWIDWQEDLLSGGSDPRKDGCAIGY